MVGIASNGRELVSETVRLKPGAVVLDISMPTLNGFEAARQITDLVPTAKLLFLTQTSDRAYVEAAFAIGGSAYIGCKRTRECSTRGAGRKNVPFSSIGPIIGGPSMNVKVAIRG